MNVTEDVLVSVIPPTTLNNSFEFENGEDLKSAGDLDISIKSNIEHYEIDDSEAILQESCEYVSKSTDLDFDDDILLVEYESFSCRFDVNVGLDEGVYESFLLTPSKLTSFLNLTSLNL